MHYKVGEYAVVTKFYSDIPIGTIGQIVKVWEVGCVWVKLYFGKNQSGQKMYKSFPADCISKHEADRKFEVVGNIYEK